MRVKFLKNRLHLPSIIISLIFKSSYRLKILNKPTQKLSGTVLIGNHTSFIDWAFVQIGVNHKIHFFIEKEIYEKPILKPFLSLAGALPIDHKNTKESFKKGIDILRHGGTVVIFPEGELTKNGDMSKFKRGFEFLAQKSGARIVPFYLDGLFGSKFSKLPSKSAKAREITLAFGDALDKTDVESAQNSVLALKPPRI